MVAVGDAEDDDESHRYEWQQHPIERAFTNECFERGPQDREESEEREAQVQLSRLVGYCADQERTSDQRRELQRVPNSCGEYAARSNQHR